jgi:hypothetical protein
MAEMVLILKEGKSWAPAKTKDDGKPVSIYVTKIDTGAGEVVMEDDGAIVARVFPDPSGDERAAAEERERAEEERVKRKKEARRAQEEREERERDHSRQEWQEENERMARREAWLEPARNILYYIVVVAVVAVGAVIVIGVVCFGAVLIADAARSVEIIYDEDGNVVSLEWLSADTDAEMVPADAIANPTLFKRLLDA